MRFLPYAQSASLPNIIVDGSANESTILTLSHWPKSNTPSELKRDIEERADLDLAVVRVPADLAAAAVHRFTQRRLAECHPGAIHTRTRCSRIFLVQGNRVEFQYRYESWVQMISRRPQPRVDLSDLAAELNREEQTAGSWAFDGVDQITPRHLEGSPETSISPDRILKLVEDGLRIGAPAWNPY